MLIRRARRFTSNEITDAKLYLSRREWMISTVLLTLLPDESGAATPQGQPLGATRNEALSLREPATKFEAATTYNNFYEFGVNKDDPARLAHTLTPRPWTVKIQRGRSGSASNFRRSLRIWVSTVRVVGNRS